jgi:LAO/AO transport system kinase
MTESHPVKIGKEATVRELLKDEALHRLLADAKDGARGALARLLSIIERDDDSSRTLDHLLPLNTGNTILIGVTGAPGAGKSTLTSVLIGECRRSGNSVAVIAVDPSSPVSNGAILGDRVRMHSHSLDPQVYVRSMATRGWSGGLARAVPQAIRLLSATGWQVIIVETVGVGQVELEVVNLVDTTVVILNPGWGDAVQAYKAGLMEMANIYVINKADREGVSQTRADIQNLLSSQEARGWLPPVLETIATSGAGCGELWPTISRHREYLLEKGLLGPLCQQRTDHYFQEVLAKEIREKVKQTYMSDEFSSLRQQLLNNDIDIYTAIDLLLSRLQ